MPLTKSLAILVVFTCVAVTACSSPDNKTAATTPAASAAPATPAPAPPPPPYVYDAPVKGHYKETNTGSFDLVDGLAYPDAAGGGTVVYVTSKSIASPVLSSSMCPVTEARALMLIRNGNYAEVTIDGSGRSKFYSAGTQYDGSSRSTDVGSREWSIKGGKPADGKIAGSVDYRRRGTFEFTLPIIAPKIAETSQGAAMDGGRFRKDRRTPAADEATKMYTEMRKAAVAKDLKRMLELQGFDAKTAQAIRGLAGIDAELAAHADRFLDPGAAEADPSVYPGQASVGAKGTNSKGKKFYNYYYFEPCGDRLLLTQIALNEQK